MIAPNDKPSKARFSLGRMAATPAAIEAMKQAGQNPLELFLRHQQGDWGDACLEDAAANEVSLAQGLRLMSVYALATGKKVWLITEADRSLTTIILPCEY